jgi:hypothetical protein
MPRKRRSRSSYHKRRTLPSGAEKPSRYPPTLAAFSISLPVPLGQKSLLRRCLEAVSSPHWPCLPLDKLRVGSGEPRRRRGLGISGDCWMSPACVEDPSSSLPYNDGDGLITTIDHNGIGHHTAISGPFTLPCCRMPGGILSLDGQPGHHYHPGWRNAHILGTVAAC